MRLPQEQIDNILASKERCCEQCTSPVPLLCWRYKLTYTIDNGRLPDPNPATDTLVGEGNDNTRAKSNQKGKEHSQFFILDTWRDSLVEFLEKESGSYSTSDKPWLRAFYEYEIY